MFASVLLECWQPGYEIGVLQQDFSFVELEWFDLLKNYVHHNADFKKN